MTKEDIEAVKNKVAALRVRHKDKIGRIHKRKTHENEMFHLEMQAIQATCSHPEKADFGLGASEECLICGKTWSFFK